MKDLLESLYLYQEDNGQGEGAGTGNGDQQETPAATTADKAEPTEVNLEEVKAQTKNEILRDLSKELGVNVFEAEGLQQVKELIDSQKSEQEKLNEKLQTYEQEREQWQKQRLEYESKLKASELGIHPDNMEDALKLAENDPSKLADVVKKYPIFKTKDGIKIGIQDPQNQTPPSSRSDVEAYMAEHPELYRKVNKK